MPERTPPANSGYGYVAQSVMRNSKFSKVAKAIYGVLAVFADSDSLEAHPSTSFIHSIIGVTPQTFRNNRKQLMAADVIRIEYQHRTPIYTMTANNFIENGGGYGYLPKSVMLDHTLSRNARVLYAYLASFAGMRGKAHPSIELIRSELGMSLDTLYSCRNELKEHGLMTITKSKADKTQKYFNNVYTLTENQRILGSHQQLNDRFYTQSGLKPIDYYKLAYDNIKLTSEQEFKLEQYSDLHDWDVVNLAIWKARRHKKPFNYIIGIIDRWDLLQIETVEQAKANDDEFYTALSKYDW